MRIAHNIYSLKQNSNFQDVFKNGVKFYSKFFVMYHAKNDSEISSIGLIITRKIGKAVTRNKYRRWARSILCLASKEDKNLTNNGNRKIIMIFKNTKAILNFDELNQDIKNALSKIFNPKNSHTSS